MTSVYRYMKLSVIVIPRISPSTAAAAAAQCQQVVPYTKPPFSSNEAAASSFILPKKFLQSLPPSPQKQYLFSSLSSSILILSHLPIYFCVPVPVPIPIPYLTQATLPHSHSHLFLTNPSERNHSSQCVVEAFRFTRPHFSISARLFMLMGSVDVGFQCSKSTMDLVEKRERKKEMLGWFLKFKRGMGGRGNGERGRILQCFGLSIPEDVSESAVVGGEAHSPYGAVRKSVSKNTLSLFLSLSLNQITTPQKKESDQKKRKKIKKKTHPKTPTNLSRITSLSSSSNPQNPQSIKCLPGINVITIYTTYPPSIGHFASPPSSFFSSDSSCTPFFQATKCGNPGESFSENFCKATSSAEVDSLGPGIGVVRPRARTEGAWTLHLRM